jgi:hypothetical protein
MARGEMACAFRAGIMAAERLIACDSNQPGLHHR